MLRGLFARRAGLPARDREAAERVKAIVLAALAFPPGTEVAVSEIVCLDPACPGTETVMLVMAPSMKTRAAKLGKAAAEITEPEVRAALAEAGFELRP